MRQATCGPTRRCRARAWTSTGTPPSRLRRSRPCTTPSPARSWTTSGARASPGDAYESGTRAYPDRPYASAGEFVGAAIPQQASCVGRGTICRFLVTLVPDDDWRPGTFTWVGGVAREPAGPLYGEEARFVAGRAPIELVVIHDPTLPGRYATESVTFAAGAPAFTACTDAGVTLAWTDEIGSPREAPVRDCDRFEAWTPTTA